MTTKKACNPQSPLRVVAAWVRVGNLLLLHQRPCHKARGGLWELPGGKVEPGESDAEALRRECEEELGVRPRIGARRGEIVHAYSDIAVHLLLYRAFCAEPPPAGPSLDGGTIAYFTLEGALALPLCEADRILVGAPS